MIRSALSELHFVSIRVHRFCVQPFFCSLSVWLVCLLTQMYPLGPNMRSTSRGSEAKCNFRCLTRIGGTQMSYPFRS